MNVKSLLKLDFTKEKRPVLKSNKNKTQEGSHPPPAIVRARGSACCEPCHQSMCLPTAAINSFLKEKYTACSLPSLYLMPYNIKSSMNFNYCHFSYSHIIQIRVYDQLFSIGFTISKKLSFGNLKFFKQVSSKSPDTKFLKIHVTL